MALVMMVFTPVVSGLGFWMGNFMQKRAREEQRIYAEAGAIAEETFGCIRTVLALNGGKQELQRSQAL